MSLTVLVLCLVLFFIILTAGMLADQQTRTFAMLRSRGATSGQIFGSLVTQAILLGLLALLVGPLLAVLLTRALAQPLLAGADQGALGIVAGNPVPAALSVALFALVTVLLMVPTLIITSWGTASSDVLEFRREKARATRRPLWQLLNLDVLACIIALLIAGFSFYLTNSGALDTHLRLLFLSPLNLLGSLTLLLAAMLLLLRGFPLLLRGGAWLATRLRGVTSLLALVQMARTPRQSVRMTLLLSLATAFTIFTLIFNASQAQRIQDVADYQAMADFSGDVYAAVITPQQLMSATQAYLHMPGVLSASLGYSKSASAGGSDLNLPIDFKAVDSSTFTQTVRWSAQDSTQGLPSLMHQLAIVRASATREGVVPAIVDSNTWDELHLAPGTNFTLNFSTTGAFDLVHFIALAEVQHIPTSGNASVPGVMADYLTFAAAETHNYTTSSGFSIPLNYVWLRTSDNPAQLQTLRTMLNKSYLSLEPLYDRRQIAAQLLNEPLYHTLLGILLLGATTAFLLALLGNLVASWLNANSRLLNFAALRALGATPRQIASILAWEQIVIYSTALLFGSLFGWLLSMLALPSLIFTSVLPGQLNSLDNATFYAGQTTPPIQIVIPPALWLVLSVLAVLCSLALGIMVRVVAHPSIAQVLRLDKN